MACNAVDGRATHDWLRTSSGGDFIAGYDRVNWPASVCVLHATYVYEGVRESAQSCRQAWLNRNASQDRLKDLWVREDSASLDTGLNWWSWPPQTDWRRVRWAEIAEQWCIPFQDPAVLERYPRGVPLLADSSSDGYAWGPMEGWPEPLTLERVVAHLASQDGRGLQTPCRAFYASFHWPQHDEPLTLQGSLEEIVQAQPDYYGALPLNWWPEDKSWFVLGDVDRCYTKVSGTRALIDALVDDPELETFAVRSYEPGEYDPSVEAVLRAW